MNKYEFMQNLQRALPHLAPAEQAEILADFEEHFTIGLAAGKSEAEICAELGSPYEIAQQYKEGWTSSGDASAQQQQTYAPPPPTQPQQPVSAGRFSGSNLVLVILLNVFLGVPIWISLYSTLFGFWVTSGSLGVAAVVLLVVAIAKASAISLALVLFAVALLALTVLSIILMVYLTKWLCLGLVKYIGWNRKLIMGGSPA